MSKKRKYTKRSSFWKRKPTIVDVPSTYPHSIEQEFCNLALDHGLARTEQLLKRVRIAAHAS